MQAESTLRRELAEVCRVLFRLRLVDYMGHPSVRIPGTDRLLIKPRHSERIRAQDQIRPEDMALIDLEGRHPILPILHVEGELVERAVPMWPHAMLVTDADLGGQLAAALGDHRVVLLQGHGVASAAATLAEAALQAIHLEHLAEAQWRVLAMGRQPRVIPSEELRQRTATGVGWQVRWAYYRQLAGCDE